MSVREDYLPDQSIHKLMTTSKGKLDAIYPSLLATLNNVAPYLEHVSAQSTSKLLQLFSSMSSPSFLLANETNHTLLHSLLNTLNTIVEHQYKSKYFTYYPCTHSDVVEENFTLVQSIFKYRYRFESLRSFTLESGQEELERLNRRKKEEALSDMTSPVSHSRSSSVDSIRSPPSARSTGLSNVPGNGAFAIGEDEESENETQETPITPSHSSPLDQNLGATSISSVEEPLPSQLRGMSEKARGKMPAGQPSFSRQNSSTSLSYQLTPTTSRPDNFFPSKTWIDSWLPTLPLHTILTLISYPSPPDALPDSIDTNPPRLHLFEWTSLSLGWYESLLWGFIFAAEMVVQNGAVGIWNGTHIRLFRVQHEGTRGPSLMKPRGAVDAVGSRLVSGIGSLTTRASGITNVGAERHPAASVRDV